MKKLYAMALIVVVLVLAFACQKKEAQTPVAAEKRITVVTTLFPLYDFVRCHRG